MPDTLAQALIVIAVSKYKGALDDLPGTLVSAKRFIDWAVNDQFGPKIKPDNVLTLTDDDDNPLTNGGAVSVELLKEHIKPFLENRMIDRLVVYFAGHGIARSESDQFWLLTNAEFDTSQGIDVRLFRRKLGKYGFGQFNDDLANEGQVWLIGDACRNPANSALEFDGDAILTMGGRTKDTVFDLFFATSLGDFAYQVPGDGAAAVPYCLFSQAFLDCMSGEFLDAIETEHHQFKPVITNFKLKRVLKKLAKQRAQEMGEDLDPDIHPSIPPPYNFYARFGADFVAPDNGPGEEVAEPAELDVMGQVDPIKLGGFDPNKLKRASSAIASFQAEFSEGDEKDKLFGIDQHFGYRTAGFVTDLPGSIFMHREETSAYRSTVSGDTLVAKREGNWDAEPVFIRSEAGWTLVPIMRNTIASVLADLPGDVQIVDSAFIKGQAEGLNGVGLSDFVSALHPERRKISDAAEFADQARYGKEGNPYRAIVAGYLYELAGDYGNIARTAHYMSYGMGTPFDLAMLCAERLYWEWGDDGRCTAFADLPAVTEIDRDSPLAGDRPDFALRGFPSVERIRLTSCVPFYQQGWKFLQSEDYLGTPDNVKAIAGHVKGRSATNLTDDGMQLFAEVFGYEPVERAAFRKN